VPLVHPGAPASIARGTTLLDDAGQFQIGPFVTLGKSVVTIWLFQSDPADGVPASVTIATQTSVTNTGGGKAYTGGFLPVDAPFLLAPGIRTPFQVPPGTPSVVILVTRGGAVDTYIDWMVLATVTG
jgi:hypothetical protein